jgi:hypothetical protein
VAELAAQAHRLNGTKVNIDLPQSEQLSPTPKEHSDFFEQEFTSGNFSEQRQTDVSLKQETALSADTSLSQHTADVVQKKPIKKITVCFLIRLTQISI